jgi:hypothetical protein
MIKLKDSSGNPKSNEEVIAAYKELKAHKERKIDRLKKLMKERPIPEDIFGTLGIWDRQGTSARMQQDHIFRAELEEKARNVLHDRTDRRIQKHKELLKQIDKELEKRGA